MNWLLSALKPLLSWLISFGLNKIAQSLQHYIEEKEKAKQREAALNKAKAEVIAASQAEGITETERIQRQKDAFKKLTDTYNSAD